MAMAAGTISILPERKLLELPIKSCFTVFKPGSTTRCGYFSLQVQNFILIIWPMPRWVSSLDPLLPYLSRNGSV